MKVLCATCCVLMVLGCEPTKPVDSSSAAPSLAETQAALAASDRGGIVPHGEAEAEMVRGWAYGWAKDAAHGAATAAPWECDASLYGFDAPPTGSATLPNESESTTGLLVGWPQYGGTVPELIDLILLSVGHADVTIVVPAQFQPSAEAVLRRHGLDDAQLDLLNWVNLPIDSVWMRDYGPDVLVDADGARQFVDPSYYPSLSRTCNNLVGRAEDDAVPTRLADVWQVPVHRPQALFEGGNLLSDGRGTCFRARDVANLFNCNSRFCYTEDELNEALGAAYGCEVVAMDSLVGDVIDHIDMWMAFVSPTTALVGRYDVADDPENAAILDGNAARLESMGYRVARIPMPSPWCFKGTATCIADDARRMTECGDRSTARVWATYTNSIRVGDRMIVPVYRWAPDSMRDHVAAQEAEALAVYQAELDLAFGPGAVEVVAAGSDAIIPCLGTFHCISKTYR